MKKNKKSKKKKKKKKKRNLDMVTHVASIVDGSELEMAVIYWPPLLTH
jgi:hypothetical protein